jgi:hypothetical protein
MEFWPVVLSDIISGVVVAAVVALFAFFVIGLFERRRAENDARKDRDLATATALYQAHGDLFAAWKVWEFDSRGGKHGQPLSDTRRSEIVGLAASAEGSCESLLIRIALEHDLNREEEAALWCLRMAFKELRYAIRDDRPLGWWRSDTHGAPQGHHEYQAFKTAMAAVAGILMKPRNHDRRSMGAQRTGSDPVRSRTESLGRVTGNKPPKPVDRSMAPGPSTKAWVLVADQIDDHGSHR